MRQFFVDQQRVVCKSPLGGWLVVECSSHKTAKFLYGFIISPRRLTRLAALRIFSRKKSHVLPKRCLEASTQDRS